MGPKKLAVLAAATLLGLAASSQAAPMLPRPFTFYQKGHQNLSFSCFPSFHMYFMAWRDVKTSWQPQNIYSITQYLNGKTGNGKAYTPPWYKIFNNKAVLPVIPSHPQSHPHPPIPEPTSLALLGGGALFLIRRKREA